MLPHHLPPELNQLPIRLTKDESKNPKIYINNFFGAYHLHEIRRSLGALIGIALTTNNTHFNTAKERDSLLWFYYQLKTFIEAVYNTRHQKLKKPAKKQTGKRTHS